jgi:gliding motility-associated-like protein
MKTKIKLLLVLLSLHAISDAQPCSVPDTLFVDDTIVVCSGTSYQLNAPVVPGATYQWFNAAATPSVTLGVNGRYWLQMSDGSCTKSDTVTVLFNSFLLSPQVNDLKLCKGQPARPLPAQGQNLLWYADAIGGTGSSSQPVVSTADTGRATYWVSQTIRGCESPRLPIQVKVIDKPMFNLGDAYIIPCGALGVVMQVVPDGESEYLWSNGITRESITATSRGQYSLYAENMCGNHRDTTIAVECEDKCVLFPTAFTPNGDGRNDKYQAGCFCPVSTYKLIIYNRNGEVVFQTKDPNSGWNGYFRGQPQPDGVYVYYAEFFDFVIKQNRTQKGTLVLMR